MSFDESEIYVWPENLHMHWVVELFSDLGMEG